MQVVLPEGAYDISPSVPFEADITYDTKCVHPAPCCPCGKVSLQMISVYTTIVLGNEYAQADRVAVGNRPMVTQQCVSARARHRRDP